VRAEPLAPLSPLPRVSCRSRGLRTRESRRDRLQPYRVNGRVAVTIRDTFHLTRTVALRRPLERPASDFTGSHGLATAVPDLDAFSPAAHPCGYAIGPGPRPRAPLPSGVTLLWASASLADFCNLFLRRAGTPNEPSFLAREWSFHPATRRHQPMPVALASSMRCRTDGLRATTSTRRLARTVFHLRGRG